MEPCALVRDVTVAAIGPAADLLTPARFGTFNVCTLGDGGVRSGFVAGRPSMVRRQVRELGIHVLGLQEARPEAGIHVLSTVSLSCRPAPAEVPWAVRCGPTPNPYACVGGKDLFFRPSDFVALFASPRLRILRVIARRFQCTIAVAHAPHTGEALVREAWWADLSRRLSGQPDLVLLVDANGRLGSSTSAAVGNGGFCQVGFQRWPASQFPLGARLVCSCHLRHARGHCLHLGRQRRGGAPHRLRMSLCLAPGAVTPASVPFQRATLFPGEHLCAVQIVDAAGDWEDHFLVSLIAHLVIKLAPQSTRWRGGGAGRAALSGPVCCASFQDAVRAIPPVPWRVFVDERERSAASAVCDAAKAALALLPIVRERNTLTPLLGTPSATDALLKCSREACCCRRAWHPAPHASHCVVRLRVGRAAPGRSCPRPARFPMSLPCVPLSQGGGEGFFAALRVFLRHSGGVLKGHLKAACDVSNSWSLLPRSLLLRRS